MFKLYIYGGLTHTHIASPSSVSVYFFRNTPGLPMPRMSRWNTISGASTISLAVIVFSAGITSNLPSGKNATTTCNGLSHKAQVTLFYTYTHTHTCTHTNTNTRTHRLVIRIQFKLELDKFLPTKFSADYCLNPTKFINATTYVHIKQYTNTPKALE